MIRNVLIGVLGCFLLVSCSKDPVAPVPSPTPATAVSAGGAVQLLAIYPSSTPAGTAFNKLSNGNSAMSMTCSGNGDGGVIVFDGKEVPTVRGPNGACLFSMEIPPSAFEKAGSHTVMLRSPRGDSNPMTFVVTP